MHPKDIEGYIKLLKKTDVCELEIEEAGTRIKIVRALAGNATQGMPLVVSHTPRSEAPPAAKENDAAKPEPAVEKGRVVESPFVGTFYRSPSPEAPPFAEVGSIISKGQTLCIVEAMKLMNEIESDFDGKVTKVFVENGQPVEYGDKLFLIED